PRLFPGWQLCGAECIGKTLRRRAWFEGFLLALMGHPTRKPDDFESRTDASIGVGKTLDINLRHTCERRALERETLPLVQTIGRAHARKAAKKRRRRAVPHHDSVAVHDRQGKTRTVQKIAKLANVDERGDARRYAALHLNFSGGECRTQFRKGVSADQ